jgi:hypothetical protein
VNILLLSIWTQRPECLMQAYVCKESLLTPSADQAQPGAVLLWSCVAQRREQETMERASHVATTVLYGMHASKLSG